MKRFFAVVAVALLAWSPPCPAGELRWEHVAVSYTGISEEYAGAIGRTVEAARAVAAEKFGFDMPETIVVTVHADPSASVRLFNDGQDRINLTVRSEKDLGKPSSTGIFQLYGLCHEVGHLAMYRPIRERRWMTTAAAEGWAHYLGSRLVDEVHAKEGPDLWPDRYDYRADGTKRLDTQLAAGDAGEVPQGAGLWKELVAVVGDRGIAPIFDGWGKANVDPADPGPVLAQVLADTSADARVSDWWKKAEGTLVEKRARSDFAAKTADAGQLAGKAQELLHDDGQQAGKRSIAGGGHAVRFEVPGDGWHLTGVRIYGSRYGYPAPPREDFHVWLCDEDFREVADFPFPYGSFERGEPGWVTLETKPTKLPRRFIVCVGFNPTGTKGVFVGHDAEGTGNSLVGLPGGRSSPLAEGDWLIRATVVGSGEPGAPAVATEPTKDAVRSRTRTWTDASGKFTVEAELVDVADGNVRLKRTDGTVITVPIDKLSEADQKLVRPPTEEPTQPGATAATAEPGPETVYVNQLAGKPRELKRDDGNPAGKKSFPMGHAVAFDAPGGSCYLTSVRIHGGRYGYPQAPKEDFHVSLCDEKFNPIADFPFDYSKFERGDPAWVMLRVKPTRVPAKFVICADFNPERTKGVFVSHDAEGEALVGKAGKPAGQFNGGDWLIRATVDQLKDDAANP